MGKVNLMLSLLEDLIPGVKLTTGQTVTNVTTQNNVVELMLMKKSLVLELCFLNIDRLKVRHVLVVKYL